MGAKLGDLVVSLEANMAKFQSDMDKSAKVTEQSMLKMATSSDQAQKALKGLEAQADRAKSAALSMGKGLIIGAAAGMGMDAIRGKILGVISTMADLKTISEKTGASVENLSILSFLSKQAGSDINGVAGALAKMSKGMAGADNDTKGAGLALSYLGVSAKDAAGNLKDPAVMFMDIAKKLAEYKDGAGKAAVAQALFGKAGAEMLPTLKLLGEQGELTVKVTTAQATAARQYERDLAKLSVQQNMVFKTVALQLLPTMSDFTNAMLDASKNTNILNKSAKGLAEDNSITTWADSGAMGLARMIDVIVMIPKALSAVSASFKVAGADLTVLSKTTVVANPVEFAKKFIKGENPLAELNAAVQERNKVKADADAKYENLWNYDGSAMEKAMAARIANRGKATTTAGGKPLKDLNYDSSGEDGEAGKREAEAGKLAKNTSAGRLKDLEAAHAKEQSEIEFANKYMAELRAQDIIDLSTYNDYRQKVLESGLTAAVEAYDKEIKEAEKYRDSLKKGSEKVAAQTKVNELTTKKDKAVQDAQYESRLATLGLSAAQSDLNKSVKEWIIQQDQAAGQFQFEISMYGKSAIECAKLTAARRIYLDVEEQIRREQKNSVAPIDRASFDQQRDAAIARSNALYDQADTKQRDPWFNMQESIRKYGEEADNVGAQIGNAMTGAFRGAEDAFVAFTATGKLSFSSMATSILSDIARIEARKAIAGFVDMAVGGIGGLFGGSSGGGSYGPTPDGGNISLAGARASGGPVSNGSAYLVGERGPEIFTPSSSGAIIPNSAIGGSGGIRVNTSITLSDHGASSETSGDSSNTGRALAEMVNTKVKEVLMRETRQGGILWNQQMRGFA